MWLVAAMSAKTALFVIAGCLSVAQFLMVAVVAPALVHGPLQRHSLEGHGWILPEHMLIKGQFQLGLPRGNQLLLEFRCQRWSA